MSYLLGILVGFIINVLAAAGGWLSYEAFAESLGSFAFVLSVMMLIIVAYSGYFTASKAPKMSLLTVLVMGACSDILIAGACSPNIDELTWGYTIYLFLIMPMIIVGWLIFDLREKQEEQAADNSIDWVYEETPKKVNIKKIIKTIVALVLFIPAVMLRIGHSLGENMFFYEDDPLNYISGYVLAPFLITLIIYKIFKKRVKSILFPAIIFIIIVVFSTIGSIQSEQPELSRSDMNLFVDYQKSFLQEVMNNMEPVPRTFDEETYGKAAAALEIYDDYLIECYNIIKNMGQEVVEQDLDIDKILSPEVLTNNNMIVECNKRFDCIIKAFDQAESEIKRKNNICEKGLQGAGVPLKYRDAFLAESFLQNIIYYRKVYRAQQEIFRFVVNNPDTYTFDGNERLFYEQKDLDEFNSLVDEYNNALDEAVAIEEEALKKANELLKE